MVGKLFQRFGIQKKKKKNRKQILKFKLNIVDDKLVWKDEKNKSEGYDIIQGGNTITDTLEISLGGRGNK